MNLNRIKLFSLIIVFISLTNISIIFDIQYFYVSSILSLIFLAILPGILIMLLFKIRRIGFWEYFIYSIGLSLAFLMFIGLAVNWILPLLQITDKPLSLMPLLICFNFFLTIIGIIAYSQNKNILIEIKSQKHNWINKFFLTFPIVFPIMSIFGTTTLNNNGSNYLNMILLFAIGGYIFLLALLRKKITDIVYPLTILMISIALLLLSWLRSWYISGVDVNLEYHIFKLVKANQFWSIDIFKSVYNLCLSVTLLPTILSIFLRINDQYIFKLIIPIIFSITPIGIYLFLKKFTQNIYAFIATFFFISQLPFLTGAPSLPIRQDISFIFFILMLLITFNTNIHPKTNKILFLIFGFSMIVAHYSTSYIALLMFIIAYILGRFFRMTENNMVLSKLYSRLSLTINLNTFKNKKYNIRGNLIIVLLIFTFAWYSQSSNISNGLINFAHNSILNIGRIFSDEVRVANSSPLDQFNLFYVQKNQKTTLIDFIKKTTTNYKQYNFTLYPQNTYNNFSPSISHSKIIPLNINYNIASILYTIISINNKIIKIFIIIGCIYLFFVWIKKSESNIEYIFMVMGGFSILLLIMILPFASISYDLQRTYQQVLAVLSLPTILGGALMFRFLKEDKKIIILSLFFILYFLNLTGFSVQIIGGSSGAMTLNNYSLDYDQWYVHSAEIKSAEWLTKQSNKDKSFIYADERAFYKLILVTNINMNRILFTVFPSSLEKYSYVYSSYTNVENKLGIIYINNQPVEFLYPTKFLELNKNLIYNNGYSEIYK